MQWHCHGVEHGNNREGKFLSGPKLCRIGLVAGVADMLHRNNLVGTSLWLGQGSCVGQLYFVITTYLLAGFPLFDYSYAVGRGCQLPHMCGAC